jgi:hypothetical protein
MLDVRCSPLLLFVVPLPHVQQKPGVDSAAAKKSSLGFDQCWAVLLGRVGDEVMLALLLHGAVFSPLPGGNYVQLAGTPVHTVRRSWVIYVIYLIYFSLIYSEFHHYKYCEIQ